jgi:hypothetical protein
VPEETTPQDTSSDFARNSSKPYYRQDDYVDSYRGLPGPSYKVRDDIKAK